MDIERVRQAVMASFVADALALGVHWVYRTSDIDEKYGRLDRMVAPEIAVFHRGKPKGAFTHYGDQALVLLQSLAGAGGFDGNRFATDWQGLFDGYEGYVDQATKATLENFKAGNAWDVAGSGSSDLGGAARMAPLALWYHDRPEAFVRACLDQTRMTHTSPQALAAAELTARSFLLVGEGAGPARAIAQAADAVALPMELKAAVGRALETAGADTRKTIAGFGAACDVSGALPGAIHLIVSHEDDLEGALVENIMAGGDSAARGLVVGLILGLHNGPGALPEKWLEDMAATKKIISLMQ